MTVAEILQMQEKKCIQKAMHYANLNEWNLACFYKNAAKGYRIKLNKISIKELSINIG
jgi:hypothetical protein